MDAPSNPKDISSLSVEDLFILLDSPQNEVSEEVRSLIKDELASVKERWLISGLVESFLSTNSKRLLEILMSAPEPHDKYLLDKLTEGLKGPDQLSRFRHANLILHALMRTPPPIWIHKIPSHSMNREILYILCHVREMDISVVVCCCLILRALLPNMPTILAKDLDKILDCFLCLLHWAPSKESDKAFKPYLQVAVYSLFHRLYSLFPCNFLLYIKRNTLGQPSKWFFNTLRPMLEQVRLHPLLFTETKDTETSKKRWIGMDANEIIYECSKLCLDPLEEISAVKVDFKDVSSDTLTYCQGVLFNDTESSFWAPSVVPSPSTASVPVTPIFSLGSRGHSVSEPPPETAIEATPETTPFTSPLKLDSRMLHARKNAALSSPKKEIAFNCAKESQGLFSKAEKSNVLSSKLKEIQRERDSIPKEVAFALDSAGQPAERAKKESHVHWKEKSSSSEESPKILENEPTIGKFEGQRKRKASIYDQKPLKLDSELFTGINDDAESVNSEQAGAFPERKSSEDTDSSENAQRRNSSSSQVGSDKDEEGLGIPSHKSMTDLVKSTKTMRLRFLSQCGPPPDISLLTGAIVRSTTSPKFEPSKTFHRTRSFPDLSDRSSNATFAMPRRELTFSSMSLSPAHPPVEMAEASTQTVEASVFDPYENLLEALLSQKMKTSGSYAQSEETPERPSPHQMLDLLLQQECGVNIPLNSELGWNNMGKQENSSVQSYLRIMYLTMMLERQKREVHAERNRRLFGKIKHLNSLQDREIWERREASLRQELDFLKQNFMNLQNKEAGQRKKLLEMVSVDVLNELKSKEELANRQKEKLKETCRSLQQENLNLANQFKLCQKELNDKDRQLKLHVKHADENRRLQTEIEVLQKQLVLIGEVNAELMNQMRTMYLKRTHPPASKLADDRAAMERKFEELEALARSATLRQEASEQHCLQLKSELLEKDKALLLERKRNEATAESWSERCDALAKRNKTLCNINVTQMRELQGRTPTQERVESGEHLASAPNGKDGSLEQASASSARGLLSHSPIEIPISSPDAYIARNLSDMRLHSPPDAD